MLRRIRRLLGLRKPALSQHRADALAEDLSEFQALLDHQPRGPSKAARQRAAAEVEAGRIAFAALALRRPDLIRDGVEETLAAMIADLDAALTGQVIEILRHPTLRALEASWLGLRHLVRTVETDAKLRIRVMNLAKDELPQAVPHPDALSPHGPLWEALYARVYSAPSAAPFGVLALDHGFTQGGADAETLGGLARLGAMAQTPVLAGVAPETYRAEGFGSAAPGAPTPAWEALRQNEDSRYLGLCLPRVLGRLPYCDALNPVEAFVFDEGAQPGRVEDFLWISAVYPMAANIARAFKTYGWAVRIRGVSSGGEVTGLPRVPVELEGDHQAAMPPVDLIIDERRETYIAKAGFISLVPRRGTAEAAFFGAQSLYAFDAPEGPMTDDAAIAKAIQSRLPHTLCGTRYAQFIMRMAADWPRPPDQEFEDHVQAWLDAAVHPKPWELDPISRAKRPLQMARFTLMGARADLEIIPGYQFEGLNIAISLRLVLPT